VQSTRDATIAGDGEYSVVKVFGYLCRCRVRLSSGSGAGMVEGISGGEVEMEMERRDDDDDDGGGGVVEREVKVLDRW
jgi:hypothetical protein